MCMETFYYIQRSTTSYKCAVIYPLNPLLMYILIYFFYSNNTITSILLYKSLYNFNLFTSDKYSERESIDKKPFTCEIDVYFFSPA